MMMIMLLTENKYLELAAAFFTCCSCTDCLVLMSQESQNCTKSCQGFYNT